MVKGKRREIEEVGKREREKQGVWKEELLYLREGVQWMPQGGGTR